jgi:hypothetical protein
MANVNLNDIYLLTIKSTWHGQTILSTFPYKVTALPAGPINVTGSYGAVAVAFNAVGAPNLNNYRASVPPQLTMDELWVQSVQPTRFVKFISALGTAGTFPQASNTANLAGVIERRGEQANRHNVGSLHVPLANLDPGASAGTISAAFLGAASALASSLQTPMSPAVGWTMTPCLFSKTLTTAAPVIFSTKVQQTIRTMRRRTVGLGI